MNQLVRARQQIQHLDRIIIIQRCIGSITRWIVRHNHLSERNRHFQRIFERFRELLDLVNRQTINQNTSDIGRRIYRIVRRIENFRSRRRRAIQHH